MQVTQQLEVILNNDEVTEAFRDLLVKHGCHVPENGIIVHYPLNGGWRLVAGQAPQ